MKLDALRRTAEFYESCGKTKEAAAFRAELVKCDESLRRQRES